MEFKRDANMIRHSISRLIVVLALNLFGVTIVSANTDLAILDIDVFQNPLKVYEDSANVSQAPSVIDQLHLAFARLYLGKDDEVKQQIPYLLENTNNDSAARVLALFLSAIMAEREGDYVTALQALNSGLGTKAVTDYPVLRVLLLQEIGYTHSLSEDFASAYEVLQRAYQLARSIKSEFGLALTEQSLGAVYGYNGDEQHSLESYQKALERYRNLDYKPYISETLEGVASTYRNKGNYQMALLAYQKYESALEYQGKYKNLLYMHYGRAIALAQSGQCSLALAEIQIALNSDAPSAYASELYKEQASCAIATEQYDLARQALTKAENLIDAQSSIEGTLWSAKLSLIKARLYAANQQNEDAYANYELYLRQLESALSAKYSKELTQIKGRYEGERKDLDIKRLKAESDLNELEKIHQQSSAKFRNMITMFSIFIAVLLLVFGLAQRRRSKHFYAQSMTDTLTSLGNRRAALEKLKSLQERCGAGGFTFYLGLIDIDDFKSVNDTYGHAVGDEVLISIVNIITKSLRPGDIVARYGGEEFLIAMERISEQDCQRILERLLENISQSCVVVRGNEIVRTVSIGVTMISDEQMQIESALDKADQALYEAKHKGKNCVEFYVE